MSRSNLTRSSELSPLAESAIRKTIQVTSNTLEDTFDRAYALGLFLISAGFLQDGRRAIHLISQLATTELVGTPASSTNISRSLRERALMFITAASPTDARDQVLANIKVSQAILDKEELRQRRYWSEDIFRGHGTLDRTTWKTRLDPLDLLRCAFLYIVPRKAETLPDARDELEGLEALRKFINDTAGKPHLAFRRAQAIACAIDVASKHGKHDVAFVLAREVAKAPGYIQRGYACVFAACRNFIPVYIEACNSADGLSGARKGNVHVPDVLEIRQLLGVSKDMAQKAPGIILDELKKQATECHTIPLGGLPLRELMSEFSRTAQRSRPLRDKMELDVKAADSGILRDPTPETSIVEAEKRLDWQLPLDYKNILRVTNGWDGSAIPWPGFARVEDIKIILLGTPMPVVSYKSEDAYALDAKASRVLRLDDGPAYDPKSRSNPDLLLLIRDQALKHRDQSRKRVKGNDGAAVNVNYTKGDYRLVLSRGSGAKTYYAHFRDFIDDQIRDFDSALGIKRNIVPTRGKRKVPGAKHDDDDGEAQNKPLPACWFGNECRTQLHNADHAAKFDHTGPNTSQFQTVGYRDALSSVDRGAD